MQKIAFSELNELLEIRMRKNKSFFIKNQLLLSYYDFVKKVVNYNNKKII